MTNVRRLQLTQWTSSELQAKQISTRKQRWHFFIFQNDVDNKADRISLRVIVLNSCQSPEQIF